MKDKVFLDTNIIVYAYSLSDVKKHTTSWRILSNNDCSVSTQTLNEYCNVCFKKYARTTSIILSDLDEILDRCGLVNVEESIIKRALLIKDIYRYSYYDSLIIAAALECGCSVLYSEDMQHGQIIDDTLKIINPFI